MSGHHSFENELITRRNERLLDPPELEIMGDASLTPKHADVDDYFDLALSVGPIYDVLRHPNTETPMAIAIYGDWGVGKTSAMRWLHGRLDEWNERGRDKRRVKVHSIWFYPWKYHERDDVWRGLVAEIILKCLDLEGATPKATKALLEQLGQFMGKAFVDLLSAVKFGAEVIDITKISSIVDHAKGFLNPQAAYLNEFETTLEKWVGETLGDNERMAIFIDDLDRCLPEVALQVLEALKLYLNIPKLIFVVGVDHRVVRLLIGEHYKKLGLPEEKSRHYLAKMFQVEVELALAQGQIEDFLHQLLKKNATWAKLDLADKEIFEYIIRELGFRSPREIKRLVNSSLMAGAGARLSVLAIQPGTEPPSLGQGMQVFFVRRILEGHGRATLVGDNHRGTPFFQTWSEAIATGGPINVTVPDVLLARLEESNVDAVSGSVRADGETFDHGLTALLSEIPEAYHALVQDQRFRNCLDLLSDPLLGELMRLPYPQQGAAIAGALGEANTIAEFREAVARSLDKSVDQLTANDWSQVSDLDLSSSNVEDLRPLRKLTGLKRLNLRATNVTDLRPLRGLSRLTRLDISGTRISDLEALGSLSNLVDLNLSGTPVSDLGPLKGLSSLETIDLSHTKEIELEPLRSLPNLKRINLIGTHYEARNLKGLPVETTFSPKMQKPEFRG